MQKAFQWARLSLGRKNLPRRAGALAWAVTWNSVSLGELPGSIRLGLNQSGEGGAVTQAQPGEMPPAVPCAAGQRAAQRPGNLSSHEIQLLAGPASSIIPYHFLPLFTIFLPFYFFRLFSHSLLFLLSYSLGTKKVSFAGVSSKIIMIIERGRRKAWRALFTAICLGTEINVPWFQQYLISSGRLIARSLHYPAFLHKCQCNRNASHFADYPWVPRINAFKSLSARSGFFYFLFCQTAKAINLFITCPFRLMYCTWNPFWCLKNNQPMFPLIGTLPNQLRLYLSIYFFSQEGIFLLTAWVRTIKGCSEIFLLLMWCNMNWNEMLP